MSNGKHQSKSQAGLSWRAFRSEWSAWWAGKAPVFFFALKFGALIALLYALLAIPRVEETFNDFLKINAWASNGLLDLLGQGTHVSDVTIASASQPFAIAIRRGCDALEPTWLLCAAILAFPGSWKRKWAGVLFGIVVLQVLNLARIVSLYLIGSRFPALFPSMHIEVWPALFILTAIGLFVGWKDWADE